MLDIISKECCGCKACENICPIKCIKIIENTEGYLLPKIDRKKCINCDLCNKVCPFKNFDLEESLEGKVVYAKNDDIRKLGSSGGIFPELANYVISQNGIVYGAGFNKNLKLEIMNISRFKDIKILSKSKYLQADMKDNYSKIKEELNKNRIVLFVATPCYVQALKNFLDKNYSNLIIVDLVCHGVPSQKLFDLNKEWYLKKNIEIISYDFRCKDSKINSSRVFKLKTNKGEKIGVNLEEPYYYLFSKYISLRESCYNCKFATFKRCSDITIGDFHNTKILGNDDERLKGISSLLINTEKGKKIFENIKENFNFYDIELEKIIYSNGNLYKPTSSKEAKKFREDMKKLSYEELIKKYGYYSLKNRIKIKYYSLPKIFQKMIRKVLIRG